MIGLGTAYVHELEAKVKALEEQLSKREKANRLVADPVFTESEGTRLESLAFATPSCLLKYRIR